MTSMTDAEISRHLALAIGYEKENIRLAPDCARVVEVNRPSAYGESWYRFDFDSPAVIWPIAERFNAFPSLIDYQWLCCTERGCIYSDTASKAVALAVIKAKEQK